MFRKYQKVEQADVVSPQGHDVIEDELHKIGKTSAASLTPHERQQVTDALSKAEDDELS